MTAEHHVDRRELNRRARERLVADGSLRGPELTVSGCSFRAGDEVVARVADRDLRAEGASRDAYVRNGSIGTVVEVRDDGLVVAFERWGNVTLPRAYLELPATGGHDRALQHAYALTTYGAQGATFALAAPLLSDASSREGAYVAMTRAQLDLHAVTVRHRDARPTAPDDDLPELKEETGALAAAERRLKGATSLSLALEYRRLPRRPPATRAAEARRKSLERVGLPEVAPEGPARIATQRTPAPQIRG